MKYMPTCVLKIVSISVNIYLSCQVYMADLSCMYMYMVKCHDDSPYIVFLLIYLLWHWKTYNKKSSRNIHVDIWVYMYITVTSDECHGVLKHWLNCLFNSLFWLTTKKPPTRDITVPLWPVGSSHGGPDNTENVFKSWGHYDAVVIFVLPVTVFAIPIPTTVFSISIRRHELEKDLLAISNLTEYRLLIQRRWALISKDNFNMFYLVANPYMSCVTMKVMHAL